MTVEEIAAMPEKDKERFWSKVEKGADDACWPWKKGLRNGYGQFSFKHSPLGSHRCAFIFSGGKFDLGPIVRHVVCGNRVCCNPRHLGSGTHQDNADDTLIHGTRQRGDTHTSRTRIECRPRGDRHHARRTPEVMSHGVDHWASKLTPETVQEARNMRARGTTIIVIARHFRVHESSIKDMLAGRTWKWLKADESPTQQK